MPTKLWQERYKHWRKTHRLTRVCQGSADALDRASDLLHGDPGVTVDFTIKFVGDEHDPAHVVVELSGTVNWKAKGGFFEGITLRRPKIMPKGSVSKNFRLQEEADWICFTVC